MFGSENRLGTHAKEFTIDSRLRNDPELVFWRGVSEAWTRASAKAEAVSWERLHLPSFPGIERLEKIAQEAIEASYSSPLKNSQQLLEKKAKKGRAAGRWAFALKHFLRVAYEKRLAKGTAAQRQTLKELRSLEKWQELVSRGRRRSGQIVSRLEALTRHRLYTTTRVLICTVDSVERMLRNMEEGAIAAAIAIGKHEDAFAWRLQLDTVIMDEVRFRSLTVCLVPELLQGGSFPLFFRSEVKFLEYTRRHNCVSIIYWRGKRSIYVVYDFSD